MSEQSHNQTDYHNPQTRSPDFIGIGAQKAGTTWFSENIVSHPRAWMPGVKELQYFNDLYIPGHRNWTVNHRERHTRHALASYMRAHKPVDWDLDYIKYTTMIATDEMNDEWYRQIFTPAGPDRICGEITPEYSLLDDEGVAHVKRLCPDAKILFFLRDPISRNWSHARMIARNSDRNPSFEEIIEYPDVIKRADYGGILDRWQAAYGEDGVHVETQDDIAATPQRVMRRTCQFLGLEFEPDYFSGLKEVVHKGASVDMPEGIYARLKEQLKGYYEEIAERFPEVGQKWYRKHF